MSGAGTSGIEGESQPRNEADVVVLESNVVVVESNNNGQGDKTDTLKVGEPPLNYRLNESFYTSHNYYRKAPNADEAECLCCEEKQKSLPEAKRKKVFIKTPQNSPKGMHTHLITIHKEIKSKVEDQKKAHEEKKAEARAEREKKLNPPQTNPMKQQKLIAGGTRLSLEPRHDPEMQKAFDKAVVTFSAVTGVSFTALSKGNIDILIKPFFSKSTPKVHGKSVPTISRHTNALAEEIRRDVYSIVLASKECCLDYSFTSDMWRNRCLDSFISLTMHFIMESGELIKLYPFCEYFGRRKHTGRNIKMSLDTMFKALGLDDEQFVKNILLDNAPNNKLAIKMSPEPEINGLWCAIHTLQLAVKDTMKATIQNIPVHEVSTKCQGIAKYVRMSEGRNNELKTACKKKGIKYKLPTKQVPTRWNSEVTNIDSVVTLEPALQFLAKHTDDGWDEKVLSVQEFKMGATIVKCLNPLKVGSKLWEADLTPTIHLVIRELFNMMEVLSEHEKSSDKYIASFASELKMRIEERFPALGSETLIYAVGHMMDPEFRGAILLQEFPEAFEAAKKEIIRRGSRHMKEQECVEPTAIRIEPETPDENLSPAQKLLRKRKRNCSTENTATPSLPSGIRIELDEYESLEDVGDTKMILEWWVRNKKRFPLLFQVAREILSIPASSATSERVFSQGTKVRLKVICYHILLIFFSIDLLSTPQQTRTWQDYRYHDD